MYIKVNGVELFYEKEGSGPPLVLVHGNGEDHFIFDQCAKALSGSFTVYRPDSRGHGKSSRVPKLHYQDMADDMTLFIKELELSQPFFYGFSDGGIIGLLVASQHPDLLSRLMVSGANLNPKGLKAPIYWFFRTLFLFKKDPAMEMMLTEPHIGKGDLERISIPVWVTAGQRDMIRESHTREIAEQIADSRLMLLSGQSHGSYVVHSTRLAQIIKEAMEEK